MFQFLSAPMFRRVGLMFAAALIMLPAGAAENAAVKARLANLEIEIWPEYDKPATLVLLKGEIAPGADRSISVRIPASSGGPLAVAMSATPGGNLLNMPYDRTDGKDYITLRMQAPERFFHIEFYDKLNTGSDKREYRYVWPGDLAADHVSVHVKQPATSKEFSITPAFGKSAMGNDGLTYWSSDMGAAPAGKALAVTLRYTKSDARVSKDILGMVAPAAPATPTAPVIAPDAVKPAATAVRGSSDSRDDWTTALFLVLLAAAAAGIFWFNWRRAGEGGAAAIASDARFCTKCGNALRKGDRFCSKCGKAAA